MFLLMQIMLIQASPGSLFSICIRKITFHWLTFCWQWLSTAGPPGPLPTGAENDVFTPDVIGTNQFSSPLLERMTASICNGPEMCLSLLHEMGNSFQHHLSGDQKSCCQWWLSPASHFLSADGPQSADERKGGRDTADRPLVSGLAALRKY